MRSVPFHSLTFKLFFLASTPNFTSLFYFIFQGDYIWIEPVSRREFDVAIGARVISAEGRKIQVCKARKQKSVFFFLSHSAF